MCRNVLLILGAGGGGGGALCNTVWDMSHDMFLALYPYHLTCTCTCVHLQPLMHDHTAKQKSESGHSKKDCTVDIVRLSKVMLRHYAHYMHIQYWHYVLHCKPITFVVFTTGCTVFYSTSDYKQQSVLTMHIVNKVGCIVYIYRVP